MAEYIDKEDVYVYFRCSYHGDCTGLSSDCEKCSDNVIDYPDFMRVESVDVVERSKIDKAIQDIELEKHYLRHENIELDKMFDKGLDKALEILKRNIGE